MSSPEPISKPNGEVKSCRLCDYSLVLSPSDKEVKRGWVDSHYYCCHPKVRASIGKEVLPQLCESVRKDLRLCGTNARWWILTTVQPYDLTMKTQVKKAKEGGSDYGVAATKLPGVKYPQPKPRAKAA